MRIALVPIAFAVTAGVCCAKDVSILVEKMDPPVTTLTAGVPGFGYVADPQVGGEDAVLRCRHAGAWVFRTSKCDEKTLRFLRKGDMRAVLLLKGDKAKILADLERIADGGFGQQIAAFQLGDRVAVGGDKAKWQTVAGTIVKLFQKARIVVPAKDANPPFVEALGPAMASVTHIIVDTSARPEPFAFLRKISEGLANSADANVRRLKVWAIAPVTPSRISKVSGGGLEAAVWKARWLMSAVSSGKVDAVFFNNTYAEDDSGAALRYLWVAFHDHTAVLSHGVDGEVEYLVLLNKWKDRLCLVLANSGKDPAALTVDMKFNRNDTGTRRWVTHDTGGGKSVRGAIGMHARSGAPFHLTLAPMTVETVTLNVWK